MQTIIGRIIGQGTGSTPDEIGLEVKFSVSPQIILDGQFIVNVNKALTDQEIEAAVRQAVAQEVSNISGQTFTESDVRGCRL